MNGWVLTIGIVIGMWLMVAVAWGARSLEKRRLRQEMDGIRRTIDHGWYCECGYMVGKGRDYCEYCGRTIYEVMNGE